MPRLTTAVRVCAEQGWAVGDAVAGTINGELAVLRITAIGENAILARRPGGAETAWWVTEMVARGWRKVEKP